MILKSKLLILIPILAIFSNNALAEMRQYPIGNSQVRLGIDHSKSIVTDFRLDGQRFSGRIIEPAVVDYSPAGARATAKVPMTIEASVSRKAVLNGAFRLVKAGAKLALKAAPYVGAASYAYDAYKLLNPTLESSGYHYSENADAYLKVYDNALCLGKFMSQPGYYSCVGVDSSVMLALSKGGKSEKDAINLLVMQVQSDYEKIHKDLMDTYYKSDNYSSVSPKCFWNGWGVSCHIKTLSIAYVFIKNYSEELTPDKFLEIATNTIDSNPTPFVEGTGKPEYKENIKVPAGTVVTIGSVETPEGKKTYTVTFTNPANGGSSEASVQTNNSPAPTGNTGGSPDGKPDGKPDKKPDDKPDDKPDPDDKDDPKKEERPKEDDKPKEDGGLLCKVFPKILACDELPEKEEPNLEIPKENIDLKFTTDNTFKDYGECPAPVTFQALGVEYKISLEPACNLAAMMRPFIIAMAWLVASFFVARVVRNNA